MRYLLGTLSEEERAHLEDGYFSDDEKFEELEIAEDELIDRYVRAELSETDKERFEATLAGSPRVRERVQFARMWKDKLATSKVDQFDVALPIASRETPREPTSWWNKLFGLSSESRTPRLAIAFSVLLVLLGGLALLAGWLRLREESRRLADQQAALEQRQSELNKQAAELKAQAEQLAKQIPPQPSPSAEPSPRKPVDELSPAPTRPVFAFTLSPGTIRGSGGGEGIKIPADTVSVQISLNVRDTDYASYRATVNRDGRRVSSSLFLPLQPSASGGRFTFNIPAKLLSPADYTISLDGRTSAGKIDSVDDYPFRIIK